MAVLLIDSGSDPPCKAHKVIGYLATALLGVHWIAALARPGVDAPPRRAWKAAHLGTGCATLLLGLADCGLGIWIYNDAVGSPDAMSSPGGWVRVSGVGLGLDCGL